MQPLHGSYSSLSNSRFEPGTTAALTPTTTTARSSPTPFFVNVKQGVLEKHPEGRYTAKPGVGVHANVSAAERHCIGMTVLFFLNGAKLDGAPIAS